MMLFANQEEKTQFREMVIMLLDRALEDPDDQNIINLTQSRPFRRTWDGDGPDAKSTHTSLGTTTMVLTLITVDRP